MESKNYVPVYIDHTTGNHWVITEGWRGHLKLSSVNAIQKPSAPRKRFIAHLTGEPIGFVAQGEVIEIRWDIPAETAFMETWGDAKVSEHKRAWNALTGDWLKSSPHAT